jgi:ABC-type sugar transport system permease subunit
VARPRPPYSLLLPFFVALVAFWGVPLVEGLRMSLESDTLYGPSRFVGLAHYGALVQDDRFRIALWNTARHATLTIASIVPLGLGLALLLRQVSLKAQAPLRFCLLLPGLTPPTVLGFLFVLVFSGRHGLLNTAVLAPLGLPALDWLKDPAVIPVSLLLQAIWRWTGFVTLVLLAGLEGIPRAYVEMARAEGAGAGALFRDVILPQLRPLLAFCAVMLFLDAFVSFAGAYVLLGASGGTSDAGLLLVGLVYETAFTYGRFGSAAAMSLSVVPLVALGLYAFQRTRRAGAFE